MRPWVRLPSAWIQKKGLAELEWQGGHGSANIAALMVLAAIAHNAQDGTGIAKVTYNQFQKALGLSRSKVSEGLDVMTKFGVIQRDSERQSTYALTDYNPDLGGWSKLPARCMYRASGVIAAFEDFKLRSRAELDALKLFLLFVVRRDRITNVANIGYDLIEMYSGVPRSRIKTAISLLATHSLIYTEQSPRSGGEFGISNAYRVVGIEPYVHQGTAGRVSI